MSLADVIRVNTVYTRSINLERDGASTAVIHPYVPTTRALQTLGRVVDTMHDGIAPRAWSLVGPYGSGKSAFGLFTADLLGGGATVAHKHALEVLREADPALAKRLKGRLGKANGYCVALVTGLPEPLSGRLISALADGAEAFFKQRGIRSAAAKAMRDASKRRRHSVSEVLGLISSLQKALSRAGAGGLLIVVDEAGKFLEYEARHRSGGEAFLLQGLAELACAAGPIPMQIFVLMHQGFDAYARGAGEDLRNEWRKVQGRFETIPYIESAEQVLRVVGAAIVHSLDAKLQESVKRASAQIAGQLAKLGALPASLNSKAAGDLFAACFPLHPVSLLMLPVLCQKVAQSERTLFTYLGSSEPFGFLDRLASRAQSTKELPWIMPWELYDYFLLNQPGVASDHATHRRWAEVVTALERLGDADEPQTNLLKTIGLLNLIGAQGGLKASEALLNVAGGASPRARVATVLATLTEKSIVTYRKFNGEYRVWQGSDLDIDDAMRTELQQLGRVSLAELLNERQVIEPVVARRYSIEVGTLRYFRALFVDATKLSAIDAVTSPTVFYCLADTQAELGQILNALATVTNERALAAVVEDAPQIREAVASVLALERVQANRAELANDPIAQRELRDRLVAAQASEREMLSRLEESPETLAWHWRGTLQQVSSKRQLQGLLSRVLAELYPHTPRIANELINRDKPSSAAVAARNKLLAAMLERSSEPDLGIEKFPAEKAIYRSVLRATGIHTAVAEGTWSFVRPSGPGAERSQIAPLWAEVEGFLNATEGRPRPVSELFALLQQEPYGLKAGLLPILFLSACLVYQDEVAIYEDGSFVPFVGADTVERIIKAPDAFLIERFRVDGTKRELLNVYARALGSESRSDLSLLRVAKPLARFMMSLPEYVRRTNDLSTDAKTIRDLFFAARSPAKLLFRDIPDALTGETASGDRGHAEAGLSDRISRAFVELRVAYHGLLREFEGMVARALLGDQKPGLADLRIQVRGRYEGLQGYTIDTQGLKAFIGRLADPFGDEAQWLISLGAFLGRKPPEKWSDDDLKAVDYRLADYGKRLRDLERLRLVYEERSNRSPGGIEVVLLKAIVSNKGEVEYFVSLDSAIRTAISPAVTKALQALEELPTETLRVAALADLFEQLNRRDGSDVSVSEELPVSRTAAD